MSSQRAPALDGSRFVAALLVVSADYMNFEGGIPLSGTLATLSGLGEASYSICMLHEIVWSAFKRLGLMTTDIAAAWVA